MIKPGNLIILKDNAVYIYDQENGGFIGRSIASFLSKMLAWLARRCPVDSSKESNGSFFPMSTYLFPEHGATHRLEFQWTKIRNSFHSNQYSNGNRTTDSDIFRCQRSSFFFIMALRL